MEFIAGYFRRRRGKPYVRPWALATPIAVLLVCLPLLRPLRHPGDASADEALRLATISALVEHHEGSDASLAARMAIESDTFNIRSHLIRVDGHLYSDQPPMLAFLLAGPYWLLHARGYRLEEYSVLVPYLLTLIGVTIPAAAAAGLVYRMGRIFELRRPWRCALAAAVVFATGLISYAVVLNAHVPAAVLVLGSAGALIHLAASKVPSRGGGWLVIAGLCAGLAATIDMGAVVFLVLLLVVVPAMPLRLPLRIAGVILYLLGALPPLLLNATLTLHLTGDVLPGFMHPELAAYPSRSAENLDVTTELTGDFMEDQASPAPPRFWQRAWRAAGRLISNLVGEHGLLVHFPVILLGVVGMLAVMHRHWPLTTKILAGASAAAILIALLAMSRNHAPSADSGFANRWLILFLPILFFWTGAWLRREHHPATWVTAGVLLIFSVMVSLIGTTDPMPHDGYDGYTPIAAIHRLINPPSPMTETAVADR